MKWREAQTQRYVVCNIHSPLFVFVWYALSKVMLLVIESIDSIFSVSDIDARGMMKDTYLGIISSQKALTVY